VGDTDKHKWLFSALLVIQAHFAASYLVPLDAAGQGTFGGLLRWAWPWGIGDDGPLGEVTTAGFPVPGFFLAVTTAGVLLLAALAVAGIWVPPNWWRILALTGAVLSLTLMLLFVGPTKLVPLALDLVVLGVTLSHWSTRTWSAAAT
jgi:hypothetical protein